MSEFTPWLGICHLRQAAGTNAVTQPTLAAAWADCIESFEREMHVHTNARSLQMIWAEDVMPANEWLTKHPHGKDGQRLTGKVNAKHLVEVGALGVGATGLGLDGTPDGEAEGYLHIEEIEGVEPLDMQFGVHPPKTVPDALYEPLFGQPEPSAAEVVHYGTEPVPPLNTYAILDAAKVVNFVEMLEASGLEHRCLFKGEAVEEMRDVAPYVVQLEEDVDFTRNLFSHDPEQEVPWFMWNKEPGIYVRSRGSLDDMWKHFRKFTKVQDENGKWFYFRFWEPLLMRYVAKFTSAYPSLNKYAGIYSQLIVTEKIIAISGGNVSAVEARKTYEGPNLIVSHDFFSFLFPIAKIGINEKTSINMEQVFYDLPILWMSGLRSRETVEAYSKLSKSRDLLMIAQKVIISECTTRAAKEATVQYISRFV